MAQLTSSVARSYIQHGACGALLALLALGCGDTKSESSYDDHGPLCARSSTDGAVRVKVQLPTCLSSSCDRVVEESCSITADGDILQVSSHWIVASTEGQPCTADCGYDTCVAHVEGLATGTYTLQYGDASAEIEVPSTTPVTLNVDAGRGADCDIPAQ